MAGFTGLWSLADAQDEVAIACSQVSAALTMHPWLVQRCRAGLLCCLLDWAMQRSRCADLHGLASVCARCCVLKQQRLRIPHVSAFAVHLIIPTWCHQRMASNECALNLRCILEGAHSLLALACRHQVRDVAAQPQQLASQSARMTCVSVLA